MSDAKPQRRKLKFSDLDSVLRDVETLSTKGYRKAGNWDLAQVCNHLAMWLSYPVKGFPKAPAPIRMIMWIIRKTSGPSKLKKYIAEGEFPAGKPTVPQTVPSSGGDQNIAIRALKESVETLKNHNGDIVPSPVFGPMDKQTCVQMQLVHCAHHLSFLVPEN